MSNQTSGPTETALKPPPPDAWTMANTLVGYIRQQWPDVDPY